MVGRQRVWDAGHWPDVAARPRVLVEDADGAVRAVCERHLPQAGFDVMTCGGPREMGRCACPLTTAGSCDLAAGADVVYTSLGWRDGACVEVLDALRSRYPHTPIVVEVTAPDVARMRPHLNGCQVVLSPVGRAGMAAAITAALASGSRS